MDIGPGGIVADIWFPLGDMKPYVVQLQVHLENYQPINFNHKHTLQNIAENPLNKKTMLTEYFAMNRKDELARSKNATYAEFPDFFVWDNNQKTWKVRVRGDSIGRIVTVNPIEGERYYLKLLLTKVRAPTSFLDLKTVDGMIYPTFHESALARGFLQAIDSQEQCLEEASLYHLPFELRRLFATLLVYTSPYDPLKLWHRFQDSMSEDIVHHNVMSKCEVNVAVLKQVNSFLNSMGKDIGDYQLVPANMNKDEFEDLTKELRDEQSILVSESDLNARHLLNPEQEHAFHAICGAIYGKKAESFFVDGPGGTGKTFLYRALLAEVRSKCGIALATATSGIAASLLPGGRTAHSRFKIPIDATDGFTCRVSKQSSLARMIRSCKLIIWDEAPMAKRTAIEALDTLLQDVMECGELFGGKVVVLGGDFRQTLPVVCKGTKRQTINTCLIRSYVWDHLTKLRLTRNMRSRLDPYFTSFLLEIGDGIGQADDTETVVLPEDILIQKARSEAGLDKLISDVFPCTNAGTCTGGNMINRAILTTKNQFVDEINDIMISKVPGVATEYISFDNATNPNDQGNFEDLLNSLTFNGLPPHRLVLKIGTPIILLRNLDPSEGLCNGTRLICIKLDKSVIQAEIEIGDHIGKRVFLHRIPLQPSKDEFCPVPFTRLQFPVRLCYAMTINKAQGQTLDYVGVYLKEPVFAHGQLYVALSHARRKVHLKVYVEPMFFEKDTTKTTKNVVYREVLATQA